MDYLMDLVMKKLIPIMLLMTTVSVIVGLPCLLYQCYAESNTETFSLKKDSWVCSSHTMVETCHGAPFRRCELAPHCIQYTERD